MTDKNKNTKVNTFFKVLLITIAVTRLWTISLFYIFGNNSEITNRIVNDPIHHYQVGILLLVASYPLRKFLKPLTLSAIGLGILLEEWPVFLNDLGLKTNGIYHTKIDFIFVFGFVVIIYLLLILLRKKKYA